MLPRIENVEVIILGSGISGLLAAWACDEEQRTFVIVDKGPREALPRLIPGCVYLHERCGLPLAIPSQSLITMVLPNQARERQHLEYHKKIWGDVPYIANSAQLLPRFPETRQSTIWSVNHTLAWLYRIYRQRILIRDITRNDITNWLTSSSLKIISSLPLGLLSPETPLISKPLYIVQIPESGKPGLPESSALSPVGYTLYNVDPLIPWYRASSMFGFTSVEFTREVPGSQRFKKIITTKAAQELEDKYPNLLLAGRWARWERGYLSHMVYHAVRERFQKGIW